MGFKWNEGEPRYFQAKAEATEKELAAAIAALEEAWSQSPEELVEAEIAAEQAARQLPQVDGPRPHQIHLPAPPDHASTDTESFNVLKHLTLAKDAPLFEGKEFHARVNYGGDHESDLVTFEKFSLEPPDVRGTYREDTVLFPVNNKPDVSARPAGQAGAQDAAPPAEPEPLPPWLAPDPKVVSLGKLHDAKGTPDASDVFAHKGALPIRVHPELFGGNVREAHFAYPEFNHEAAYDGAVGSKFRSFVPKAAIHGEDDGVDLLLAEHTDDVTYLDDVTDAWDWNAADDALALDSDGLPSELLC